jgi:UDP-glucose:(heptosyl)LPS alpha-1,3-glucosyltransferase
MRIALVVERYGPAAGGVEQVVWNVAQGLARAGEDVHVIARRDETQAAASPGDGPAPSVHLVRVPIRWQPLRVRLFSRAAARFIAGASPGFDVVHSYTRTRTQDIYRAGGGSHYEAMLRSYGRPGSVLRMFSPRHRALLAAVAAIFRDPDQLIHCASPMVRAELETRYGLQDERFFILPNGVDCDLFCPPETEQHRAADPLRDRFDAKGRLVWLFAGSGGRRKGLDLALRALAASGDPDSLLFIAGRDPIGPWLRQLDVLGIRERVRFIGQRDDMQRVYRAVDGLLLPTRYDAFANVCLEAAASGLPIVTSAANGAATLLADAAIVIDKPEDVAGFGAALSSLADPELRRRLGDRGRVIALENTWADHVSALQSVYRRQVEPITPAPLATAGAHA